MTRQDERDQKALDRLGIDTSCYDVSFFVLVRPLTTIGVPVSQRIVEFENCIALRTRDILASPAVRAIGLTAVICNPAQFCPLPDSRRFHWQRREYNILRNIDHALWLSSSEDVQFDLYVAAAFESLQSVPVKYLLPQDSERIGQIIARCAEDSQNAELFGRPNLVRRPRS